MVLSSLSRQFGAEAQAYHGHGKGHIAPARAVTDIL
jgi:hypothetical protein